eukprot:GFUD01027569.1.p1 GENE.GFUD01027569.1~~GFUD01027569.1.p1  ORF type:complete len:152 (+),score=53.56 GFUD01027569.1:85-540(+)
MGAAGEEVGAGGDQSSLPLNESQASQPQDEKVEHLEKMTDYKTYCKGLMDIALLTANANQLRHALELCAPFRTLLIVLLSISIVLQVIASAILLVERIVFKKEDYSKCHKYNAAIGVLVIFIIVINILATAFGGPGDECFKPENMEEGSGY